MGFMEKLTDRELCANLTIRKGATDRRFVPQRLVKNNRTVWEAGRLFFCAFIFTECISDTKASQAEAQYAK